LRFSIRLYFSAGSAISAVNEVEKTKPIWIQRELVILEAPEIAAALRASQ
jgi:hypothetical protein